MISFVQINEKTKKAFLVFFALFIIILLIFGSIYALIARHMRKNAKEIDTYMVELCQYRIITNPDQFYKAVKYYERRKLHHAIKWPMRIILLIAVGLLFYCIFSTAGTTKKVFSDFFDLFPRFKWQTVKTVNEELKAAGSPSRVVGISWMPVSLIPQVYWKKINPQDINLYISTIFYIILIILFFKISLDALSYVARIHRGKEKSKMVFEKNLDHYNYFDLPNAYQQPIHPAQPQTTITNPQQTSDTNATESNTPKQDEIE